MAGFVDIVVIVIVVVIVVWVVLVAGCSSGGEDGAWGTLEFIVGVAAVHGLIGSRI